MNYSFRIWGNPILNLPLSFLIIAQPLKQLWKIRKIPLVDKLSGHQNTFPEKPYLEQLFIYQQKRVHRETVRECFENDAAEVRCYLLYINEDKINLFTLYIYIYIYIYKCILKESFESYSEQVFFKKQRDLDLLSRKFKFI